MSEAAVGLDPREELEGALPVVAVRGESFRDGVGIELERVGLGGFLWVGGEGLSCRGDEEGLGAREKK